MAKEIASGIFFVGYVDWELRDFHSFETRRGVTYNSFLIMDKKVTLIDAVKAPFCKNLMKNIEERASLDSIEYIIVNHAEPDHASGLKELLGCCKNATIVCSGKCKEILSGYNDISNWKFQIVKTGDRLPLGSRTLEFIETPMVHWPDSMFTFAVEDKVLFSMDAFGQHYSSSNKFDDEVDYCEAMEEAKRYYANIIMPFGRQVISVLEKLSKYEIKMIVPAHGIIWKKYLKEILKLYSQWANFICKPKVLVIYDTMWQSTKLMADAIYAGSSKKNIETKILSVRSVGLTDIASEVLDAPVIAFGCSTLNMTMLPSMGALLTYLKGLAPKNKFALLFGSYGWGKGAVEDMQEMVKKCGFELINTDIKAKWQPSSEILSECKKAGERLADKAIEIYNNQKK